MMKRLLAPYLAYSFRIADIHVSRLSSENALLLTRAPEERAKTFTPDPQLAYTPHGSGPCASQDRTKQEMIRTQLGQRVGSGTLYENATFHSRTLEVSPSRYLWVPLSSAT